MNRADIFLSLLYHINGVPIKGFTNFVKLTENINRIKQYYMNRFIKVLVGIIIGVLLLLLILPFAFKGKIETKINSEINKQVNATVQYDKLSLSLIRSFPDLNLAIDGLAIVGKGLFSKDTLMHLGTFSTEIDLIGAFSGEIEVKSILLKDLYVNAIVLADSSANWDIMVPSETEVVEEQVNEESSDFKVHIESFIVDNANVSYIDHTMNLNSDIQGLNLELSGDMSETKTNLELSTSIDQIDLTHDKINYINKVTLAIKAGIGADMEQMLFSFLDNEIFLNRMALQLDGDIKVKEEGYGFDIRLGTTNTDFKSLLALIPEAYMSDLEGLKTEGTMSLSAAVKGNYLDEANLPAFDLNLLVDQGMVQYPDLPESINNINVKLKVNNSGGAADLTFVNLEQFHFELGDNPFDASLTVSTPVSNPVFNGKVKGKIDLGSMVNAIPMDSFDIRGLIETDFALDGDYKMIEDEDYESLNAQGSVALRDFAFKSKELPQGIIINRSKMVINPKTIKLETFNCKIGESDFQASGTLENYLAYALKDGVLRGQLNHYSKLINSNEFLVQTTSADTIVAPEEENVGLVLVPKNIDFTLNTKVDKLIYDRLSIYKANGKLIIKDGIVKMNGLKMNLLDGALHMSGQYNTKNINKPFVNFDMEGTNLDLNKAANSFSVIDSLLPIAKNTVGKVSPKCTYYSQLSKHASPIMSTTTGGGWLRSESVEVSGSKIQNTLASTLKNDKYKKMKAEDLNINFIIDKGNIIIKPFKTKVGGQIVEVQGTQGLDQSINYKITMPVSRKEVAKMAGLMGFNLPTSGDDLMVDVLATGTVQEPVLGFDLDKAQKQVTKDLEKEGEKLLKNFLKGF